ncbi:MAG: hypothetical protein AB7O24_20685 [Kofleriaceae bacterium]
MTRGRALAAAAALLVLAAAASCGGSPATKSSTPVRPKLATPADRLLSLLPDGAQVVVELDLARLRNNPVVGGLVTRALTVEGITTLPGDIPMSPLATADTLVMAAYGVGTANAATLTLLATTQPVDGATTIGDGIVAIGPADWIAQVEARAGIAAASGAPLVASSELIRLRDHAMPDQAPGASFRVTAALPFDARVALARQTGLDSAPARLSIWGDVVDDLVIIVDADATDPGDRKTKHPTKRLEIAMRSALDAIAAEPAVRALGIPSSLRSAKLVSRGSWLRTIIAIGPSHLQRVVERANALLSAAGAKS